MFLREWILGTGFFEDTFLKVAHVIIRFFGTRLHVWKHTVVAGVMFGEYGAF